jgi:hypothetical protein
MFSIFFAKKFKTALQNHFSSTASKPNFNLENFTIMENLNFLEIITLTITICIVGFINIMILSQRKRLADES